MSRLLPFLSILIALGVIFLYIKPTYSNKIADTKEQIASFDAALAAAERFQQKEAQLEQERSKISPENLQRLDEFLPDGVDNVQLILDLDALAARSGLTLSDFDVKNISGEDDPNKATTPSAAVNPTTPAQPGTAAGTKNSALGLTSSVTTPVDSLEISFKATGTYPAFSTFLTGIESSLRPLDVVSVGITTSETSVYTYQVTVRLYWLH